INAGFLKEVSSTSSGDTASRRILNTTHIIDPSYQLRCTAYMLRNKDKPVKCQLLLPTKRELYVSGRGTIHTNCTGNCMAARINAGFLKEVSSTSSGDTASRRILNTTHIIDPSYQLRCTAYMLRNKDKPVKCQLLLPTKRELYVSGRGTIHTNCTGNCMAARINAGFLKEVSSTSSGDTASRRILNTTHIIDPSYQLRCTAYMLRNKDKPVKCQLLLPTKRELYVSGRGTIHTNCTGNCMAARINAGFLKEVSSTSSGDTASRRILNTTHIIDPSYQLRCTAYMLRNKDKPVKCQLLLPTKRELYVSGRGTIHTNCTGNCMAARINAGFLKEVSSTSSGDTASRRILNTTHIIDPSYQLRCTAYMLRNKDKPVKCQLLLPTKRELYVSGRGTIHTNCTGNCMAARINAGFLKEVSSTSSGDTASRRILNTTHIIDPSYQLRCTAYMLRNKDKPVKCQLLLPTKHELYVSGRGTIHTNCTGNCMTARINAGFLKEVSSTSSGDTASRRILNTTNIIDPSYQLRCTAYMLRNKDKPVKCQLLLPTKHKLYVSGRGTIHTNCTGNCMTARV
ncbi:hypothetical protein DPMN_018086, partial [Dreissena polymorpha]